LGCSGGAGGARARQVEALRELVAELWSNPHADAVRAKTRHLRRLQLLGEAFARQRDVNAHNLRRQQEADSRPIEPSPLDGLSERELKRRQWLLTRQ
jgi:hypothetical protein